ncbi:hypothetical protein BDW72DRAFT_199292 [Aspergillus terricola var. indicus]
MPSLIVGFIYDSFTSYRAQGFSIEECMEFDTDDTIKKMIRSLETCGHKVIPVAGIKQLVAMLAEGEHESWDLAFPTAEGMYGAGREAQVPGLLEAYQIPHVFSDAATLSLSHDKGRTKMVLEHLGIPTAPFAIVPATCPDSGDDLQWIIADVLAKSRHAKLMKFPLFIKPACEGSSKGIYSFSKVRTMAELAEGVRKLRSRYPDQSILIESFLAGSEYSVSILGTGASARVIGTVHLDWKSAKEPLKAAGDATTGGPDADDGLYDIPSWDDPSQDNSYPVRVVSAKDNLEIQRTEDLALEAWRALGCRDTGRVDLRWGLDGLPYVLEINAIPGMRPEWSTLAKTAASNGISHEQLIGAVLNSALERVVVEESVF